MPIAGGQLARVHFSGAGASEKHSTIQAGPVLVVYWEALHRHMRPAKPAGFLCRFYF
jgi:hypothetical protein